MSESLAQLGTWVAQGYAQAPALMLGLTVLVALPPLAVLGAALGRFARDDEAGARKSEPAALDEDKLSLDPTSARRIPPWPSRGFLQVEGLRDWRLPIGHGVVRVGREADNDICLNDNSVHRYHAAIHRSDNQEFVITDLSSDHGNGIVLNGRRVSEARLRNGDRIELGLARLMFVAQSA